jgi:hypothetical protein
VTNDNEEINGLGVVQGVLEPWLLDHVRCFDHLGNVAVASEVEEHSEGHDTEPCGKSAMPKKIAGWSTLLCCEVAVLGSNILELFGGGIDNLDIACDIFITIHLREVVEGLVSDLSDIELVIANRQKVIVDALENGVRDVAVWFGGVAQSRTVVQILRLSVLA